MKILHISVHLGGGVGTVLRNWIKKDTINEHTVVLLNKNYYDKADDIIHKNMRWKYDEINILVNNSDITVVHFWNHPFLFEFLINSKLPKSRLCLWSHVSGLYPPYVHTKNLIDFFDRFIVSSPISNNKNDIIWTTGDINDYHSINIQRDKDNFIIGYVGTLDYSKINPKFIDLCENICKKINNVKFVICGVGCDKDKMEHEVKKRGLESKFNFMGHVSNIKDVISTFNIFGYPLNEKHFGTCEQVLGEAMGCGIFPVVLNNPAERYIVEGYGEVCNSYDEYVNCIFNIYNNPITDDIVLKLKKRSKELYNIENMISLWNNIFTTIIKEDKKLRSWGNENIGDIGHKIFIESLGEYGHILNNGDNEEIKKLFDSNIQFRSKSKGGIYQYLDAFPNDKKLKEWSNL